MRVDFNFKDFTDPNSIVEGRQWYDYLCEYYDVTPKEALELGTRADGRRPDLPGSKTCEPVSGKTLEEIWDLSKRTTKKEVFQFYKDQGSWTTFRQVVRHRDMTKFHELIMSVMVSENRKAQKVHRDRVLSETDEDPTLHICEYGCGVAPIFAGYLESLAGDENIKLSITDVKGSEHLNFAEWRIKKIIERKALKSVEFSCKPTTLSRLPKYSQNLDGIILFETLEYTLNPVMVLKNLMKHANPGCLLTENFAKQMRPLEEMRYDQAEAAKQREEFFKLLSEKFDQVGGYPLDSEENSIRTWVKKD